MKDKGKLPNFLIVGAARSGTTSLHYYLRDHSEIFMPLERKELRFFSNMRNDYKGPGDDSINNSITNSLKKYKQYFSEANLYKFIGEASPDYLYFYQNSIKNIKNILGDPKIIIILRNPVFRAFSHYNLYTQEGREYLSFEDALENEDLRNEKKWEWGWNYKKAGLYYKAVKEYMNNFTNVKIILFEDLVNNSNELMLEINDFIGVKEPLRHVNSTTYNASGVEKNKVLYFLFNKKNILKTLGNFIFDHIFGDKLKAKFREKVKSRYRKKSEMDMQTKIEMISFFKNDIQKLEVLIERDLSDWYSN